MSSSNKAEASSPCSEGPNDSPACSTSTPAATSSNNYVSSASARQQRKGRNRHPQRLLGFSYYFGQGAHQESTYFSRTLGATTFRTTHFSSSASHDKRAGAPCFTFVNYEFCVPGATFHDAVTDAAETKEDQTSLQQQWQQVVCPNEANEEEKSVGERGDGRSERVEMQFSSRNPTSEKGAAGQERTFRIGPSAAIRKNAADEANAEETRSQNKHSKNRKRRASQPETALAMSASQVRKDDEMEKKRRKAKNTKHTETQGEKLVMHQQNEQPSNKDQNESLLLPNDSYERANASFFCSFDSFFAAKNTPSNESTSHTLGKKWQRKRRASLEEASTLSPHLGLKEQRRRVSPQRYFRFQRETQPNSNQFLEHVTNDFTSRSIELAPAGLWNNNAHLNLVTFACTYRDAFQTHLWPYHPIHPAALHEDNIYYVLCTPEGEREKSMLSLSVLVVLSLGALLEDAKQTSQHFFARARDHLTHMFDETNYCVALVLLAMSYYATFVDCDEKQADYYLTLAQQICQQMHALHSDVYLRSLHYSSLLPSTTLDDMLRCQNLFTRAKSWPHFPSHDPDDSKLMASLPTSLAHLSSINDGMSVLLSVRTGMRIARTGTKDVNLRSLVAALDELSATLGVDHEAQQHINPLPGSIRFSLRAFVLALKAECLWLTNPTPTRSVEAQSSAILFLEESQKPLFAMVPGDVATVIPAMINIFCESERFDLLGRLLDSCRVLSAKYPAVKESISFYEKSLFPGSCHSSPVTPRYPVTESSCNDDLTAESASSHYHHLQPHQRRHPSKEDDHACLTPQHARYGHFSLFSPCGDESGLQLDLLCTTMDKENVEDRGNSSFCQPFASLLCHQEICDSRIVSDEKDNNVLDFPLSGGESSWREEGLESFVNGSGSIDLRDLAWSWDLSSNQQPQLQRPSLTHKPADVVLS